MCFLKFTGESAPGRFILTLIEGTRCQKECVCLSSDALYPFVCAEYYPFTAIPDQCGVFNGLPVYITSKAHQRNFRSLFAYIMREHELPCFPVHTIYLIY